MQAVRGKFKYVLLAQLSILVEAQYYLFKKGQSTLKEMVCLCAIEQLIGMYSYSKKISST